MRFGIEDLHYSYGPKEVLHGIDLTVEPGEVVALLGPNGSGKSTLIRTACNIDRPTSGRILIDGEDMASMDLEEIAKIISYVPQSGQYAEYDTVLDTVLVGRSPYMGWEPTDNDLEIVQKAMEYMGILDLADQYINELSGGQRQRVFIARSIAQDPKLFVFDEPTSSLDLRYQFESMKMMSDLVHNNGTMMLVALHDLNLALRFSDRIVMIKDGNVVSDGIPEEVLTPELIESVYGVKTAITDTEQGRFILAYDSSA